MVVSHEESGDLSPAAVSYTSGFYQIPVIGISSRDAAFSDKNIHVSFLRTVPPYYHQADVWLEMLNHFGYTKVCYYMYYYYHAYINFITTVPLLFLSNFLLNLIKSHSEYTYIVEYDIFFILLFK